MDPVVKAALILAAAALTNGYLNRKAATRRMIFQVAARLPRRSPLRPDYSQ